MIRNTFFPLLLFLALSVSVLPIAAGQTPEFDPESASDSVPSALDVEPYSPSAALRTSLLSTLIPIGVGTALVVASSENDEVASAGTLLILAGSWFGPSVGLFNAGAKGRAWLGIGIRAAAVGGEVALLAASMDDSDPSPEAEIAAVAGALIYVGSAVVDIIAAPAAAKKRNLEMGRREGPEFGIQYLRATGPTLTLQTHF